jgi:hypothetical protein
MNKYYKNTQIKVGEQVYSVEDVQYMPTYMKLTTREGYIFSLPYDGPSYTWSDIKDIRNVIEVDGIYGLNHAGLQRLAQHPVWSQFIKRSGVPSSAITWRWRDDGFAYLNAVSEGLLYTGVVDDEGNVESYDVYEISA